MTEMLVHKTPVLQGEVSVDGDKSISHRSLLLGALAEGESRIAGFLPSGDCLATLSCLQALGIAITRPDATSLIIEGRGCMG